jgi:hypothetical protein
MNNVYARCDPMMEPFQSIANWFGIGAGAGGGFMAVRWFLEWVSGRVDKRTAHLDAATVRLIQALEERLESVMLRLDKTEKDLTECKKLHSESEARVMHLEAVFKGLGDARQHAALIVAAEKAKDK